MKIQFRGVYFYGSLELVLMIIRLKSHHIKTSHIETNHIEANHIETI